MLMKKKATIKAYPRTYLSNSNNFIHEQRISKQHSKSCYFRLTIEVVFMTSSSVAVKQCHREFMQSLHL
jgi:hypothetical protein